MRVLIDKEVNDAAVEKLATDHGICLKRTTKRTVIGQKVIELTGVPMKWDQTYINYLRAWLGVQPGESVNPPYRREFRSMAVRRHPRLAEIERAQPPMLTPCGTGNYNQYTKFMMDNGRVR